MLTRLAGAVTVAWIETGRVTVAIGIVEARVAVAVLVYAIDAIRFRCRWRAAIRRTFALILARITETVAATRDDGVVDTQPRRGITAVRRARV